MRKKIKNSDGYIRILNIECKDPKVAALIRNAIVVLDRLGYTVCKKDSLVLDNEIKNA